MKNVLSKIWRRFRKFLDTYQQKKSQTSFLKNWLNYILLSTSTLIIVLVALLLFGWFMSSYYWPSRSNLRLTRTIYFATSQQTVLIDYPSTLFANDKNGTLRLSWHYLEKPKHPLTINVDFDSNNLSITPGISMKVGTRHFEISARNESPTHLDITLKNNRSISGLFKSNSKNIMLTLDNQEEKIEETLFITIEPVSREVLRGYINGALAKDNAIIVLVAGIISAAGLVYQKYLDNLDRKQQEEKQKEAEDLLKNFHNFVSQYAFDRANSELETLLHRYENFIDQNSLNLAKAVIEVSKGGNIHYPEEYLVNWPDDFFCALIHAYHDSSQILPDPDITNILSSFPKAKLSKTNMDTWDTWFENISEPVYAVTPPKRPSIHKRFEAYKSFDIESGKRIAELVFPFNYADYLEEKSLLFASEISAFWSGHPTYLSLLDDYNGPTIIYGENGSGKTAMSTAIFEYHIIPGNDLHMLGIYINGHPDNTIIKKAMADKLLSFLTNYPAQISCLTRSDKKMLTEVLCSVKDKRIIIASLDKSIIGSKIQFNNDFEGELEKERKPRVKAQVTTLTKSIEEYEYKRNLEDDDWFALFRFCAETIGIYTLRLGIDLDTEKTKWLNSIWLENAWIWYENGIFPAVFLTQQDNSIKDMRAMRTLNIRWSENDLNLMARFRFDVIKNYLSLNLLKFNDICPPEVLNQIIGASCGNPGKMALLWKEKVNSGDIRLLF